MKKVCLFFILFISSINTYSQQATDIWAKWQFLIGDWNGTGTGAPGEGKGGFSFYPDLDNKILVRHNYADYPAANNKPAFSHKDLMIVYPGENRQLPKAIYFDNEGHVINYTIAFNDSAKSVVFTSDVITGAPQFRLTYTANGTGNVKIKFEIAPPGKPGQFNPYIDAAALRKK